MRCALRGYSCNSQCRGISYHNVEAGPHIEIGSHIEAEPNSGTVTCSMEAETHIAVANVWADVDIWLQNGPLACNVYKNACRAYVAHYVAMAAAQ